MTERISIVIPCLNEAAIARSRLLALQSLREAGHELILVDGGSSDGTPRIALPLVDQLRTCIPGRALQMNLGARTAKGRVIWFLHMDSEPPAGAAEAILAATLGEPGWGRFEVRLRGKAPLLRVVERMMNLRSRLTGIATGDQGVFVRRDIFEAAGGFPEIPLMEDIALSARLKRIARPARVRARLITSSRRWEHNGIWRTILTMWYLRTAYWLGVDPARLSRIYGAVR